VDPQSTKREKSVILTANNLEQESRILARTFKLHGREINPVPLNYRKTKSNLDRASLAAKKNEGKLFL